MKVWAILKKSLIEQVRDWKYLLMLFSVPLFFIAVLGFFYGKGFYTYKIALINEDHGTLAQEFAQQLKEAKYPNNNPVFNIIDVTKSKEREKVEQNLKNHHYVAQLYLPPDFSEQLQNTQNPTPSKVVISGDPGYTLCTLAEISLESYFNKFLRSKLSKRDPIRLEIVAVTKSKIKSEFDAMAPGLIIISIFFLLIQSAMVLVRESEQKTIQRVLLSKTKTWELYVGISLSQLVLVAIMIPILLGAVMSFGFESSGSMLAVIIIIMLSAFSSIAIGLAIAAFSNTSMGAFIIGNIIITPMFFLSGAFFPVPELKLFTIFGKSFHLLSLMPSLHAVEAMNKVMLGGAGILDVWVEIFLLVILSLVILIGGIVIFNRRHLFNR